MSGPLWPKSCLPPLAWKVPELNHQLKQAVVLPAACFELAVRGVNACSAWVDAHAIHMLQPIPVRLQSKTLQVQHLASTPCITCCAAWSVYQVVQVCAAARAQVGSSEAAHAAVGALALGAASQQSISCCAEGVSQLLGLQAPEACEAAWGRLAAGEAAAVTSAMRLDSLAEGISSAERTAAPLHTDSQG